MRLRIIKHRLSNLYDNNNTHFVILNQRLDAYGNMCYARKCESCNRWMFTKVKGITDKDRSIIKNSKSITLRYKSGELCVKCKKDKDAQIYREMEAMGQICSVQFPMPQG